MIRSSFLQSAFADVHVLKKDFRSPLLFTLLRSERSTPVGRERMHLACQLASLSIEKATFLQAKVKGLRALCLGSQLCSRTRNKAPQEHACTLAFVITMFASLVKRASPFCALSYSFPLLLEREGLQSDHSEGRTYSEAQAPVYQRIIFSRRKYSHLLVSDQDVETQWLT